jgi:hypothetical protein
MRCSRKYTFSRRVAMDLPRIKSSNGFLRVVFVSLRLCVLFVRSSRRHHVIVG